MATAPKSRGKAKTTSDVLAELEKIRRQTLRATPRAAAPAEADTNGRREISREIHLDLSADDFARAHRCLLNLQVEDSDSHVVDSVEDFEVDLSDLGHAGAVVVKLNIALRSK